MAALTVIEEGRVHPVFCLQGEADLIPLSINT